MKKAIMLLILLILVNLSFVTADVVIEKALEGSNVYFNKSVDIELRSALVNISVGDYLDSIFEFYSNEEEPVKVMAYLKAKGLSCYGACKSINSTTQATYFTINSKNEPYVDEYETNEGIFTGVEFTLQPKQTTIIEIYQSSIDLPYYYYLDSLTTYSKADYEKITIKGENINVSFNEDYPLKKVSEDTWVWEYSNIDVNDNHLKDILIIERDYSDCVPKWECEDWSEWWCRIGDNNPNDFGPVHYSAKEIEANRNNINRLCGDGCGNSKYEYKPCSENATKCLISAAPACPGGSELKTETDENNCIIHKCMSQLSNGIKTEIKILPNVASQIAIEELGDLGFTIELKEVGKGDEMRMVYELTGNKQGKFLGIFKIMAKVQAQVDAENGNIKVIKPWWSFLASGI